MNKGGFSWKRFVGISGAISFTCSCVIDYFEENDYSPNDLEGKDYPAGAPQAALDCPGGF